MNSPNYYIYFQRRGWVNTDATIITFEYLEININLMMNIWIYFYSAMDYL